METENKSSRTIGAILSLTLIPVLALVLVVAVLGIGYVVTLVTPLTLFQACLLSLGSVFIVVAGMGIIMLVAPLHRYSTDSDEDEEDESFEYDYPYDDSTHRVHPIDNVIDVAAKPEKVGRNEPCPCGSGLKYKRCCGEI